MRQQSPVAPIATSARLARLLLLAPMLAPLLCRPSGAQPWAAGLEAPPAMEAVKPSQALELESLRRYGESTGLRRTYLRSANDLLQSFWASNDQPKVLFPGDAATGCGVRQVAHPMAFYCPLSKEIAMALNLRRSVGSARGKSDRELLLLDLAVLAHEWGHHINRSQGRGPYGGGLQLTAQQEELAADWRTGVFLGWMLRVGAIDVDGFTQTANLQFEMGDYERISPQHHGYPKDRFEALTRGLGSQIKAGQSLGDWTADSRETFSQPLPPDPSDQETSPRRYRVWRFEIDRGEQIATNLIGGLLGAASCIWGSQNQCLGMAAQQGKGRAHGTYISSTLSLDCSGGRFDVSDDPYGSQPFTRDGKGQAAVIAKRDCPRSTPSGDGVVRSTAP